ncbi:MAG: hypothetical protein IR527_01645 [Bacteroides sp.]|nr:MAG: hypothetical protein IR527_01645 [Bacteroides sp.]
MSKKYLLYIINKDSLKRILYLEFSKIKIIISLIMLISFIFIIVMICVFFYVKSIRNDILCDFDQLNELSNKLSDLEIKLQSYNNYFDNKNKIFND